MLHSSPPHPSPRSYSLTDTSYSFCQLCPPHSNVETKSCDTVELPGTNTTRLARLNGRGSPKVRYIIVHECVPRADGIRSISYCFTVVRGYSTNHVARANWTHTMRAHTNLLCTAFHSAVHRLFLVATILLCGQYKHPGNNVPISRLDVRVAVAEPYSVDSTDRFLVPVEITTTRSPKGF